MNSRRSFLKLLVGAACVRVIPSYAASAPVLFGDGLHDDTLALNALVCGEVIETALDMTGCGWVGDTLRLPNEEYLLSGPIEIGGLSRPVTLDGNGSTLRMLPSACEAILLKDGGFATVKNFHICASKERKS